MSSVMPPDLIDFLSKAESYPHDPDEVKHLQTHISHVFIVPPYVYKLKKPVNFGFLDFSTLEKRRFYCMQEVELNNRLCEGIYLGVVPIYCVEKSWAFGADGNINPAEYAVKMKLLSKENFLIEYVWKNELTRYHIDRVVEKLVPFYRNQVPGDEILKWGKPEKIQFNTDENFLQVRSFIGITISSHSFDAVRLFTSLYLEYHEDLFMKRIKEGRVVDGHGDLHLEHIHVSENTICIFDCIEFNDRFRFQDIAADIGFLAMDLDFHDLPDKSRYLTGVMADKLHDPDLMNIVDFYKCYRACVRGKVKSLESTEEEIDPDNRKHAEQIASRYFSLALRYALLGAKPMILVFMGRVACGKSTLADAVKVELNLIRFSSDIERKKLAGVPLHRKPFTSESEKDKLYSDDMSERTYQHLTELAGINVSKGLSVILDATYGIPEYRHDLLTHFKKSECRLIFIEASAPVDVRRKRLENRASRCDVISDARVEDLEMLDRQYHSPEELDSREHMIIGTDRPSGETLSELFQMLIKRQFL